ncbi:MAG: DUF1345 domain-containing protein, partial [Actinomycetota bacterium]|nr:DUF1345 domain-containing protein [Actinomycetota bacterium]
PVAGAAGLGVAAGVVAAFTAPWQAVPLLFWDVLAFSWVTSVWLHIVRMDADATSAHATADDPGRASADALLLSASVASLVAVLLGLLKAGHTSGTLKVTLLASAVATIVISWAAVHTLFVLRYAALFYTGADGGVDFNEDDKPCYLDFAYLAFTIGMTYQVSDTNLTTKSIRHTALRHALLSYVFGTVIIAATINLAAGLAK